jgi:hypothetical protein
MPDAQTLTYWFTALIVLQFLVVALHDLVDIPGLTHGAQVKSTIGRGKIWAATLINSLFPGVAVAFAVLYWLGVRSEYGSDYWVIYCAITVLSAIGMWYVPYLFGASAKTKAEYAKMYAGTWQVLPRRGDNPRPNVLHLGFHLLFVVTLVLACVIRFPGLIAKP